jgi:hypothetical protein
MRNQAFRVMGNGKKVKWVRRKQGKEMYEAKARGDPRFLKGEISCFQNVMFPLLRETLPCKQT